MTSTDDLLLQVRACLPDPAVAVGDEDDLLGSGVLDSLSFVDFSESLEKRFEITLPDDVLFGDTFSTLAQITDAVRSLRRG